MITNYDKKDLRFCKDQLIRHCKSKSSLSPEQLIKEDNDYRQSYKDHNNHNYRDKYERYVAQNLNDIQYICRLCGLKQYEYDEL